MAFDPPTDPVFSFAMPGDLRRVQVLVGDPGMLLRASRPASDAEMSRALSGSARDVTLIQGSTDRVVIVAWVGSACDVSVWVVVDGGRITVAPGPREACDAVAIGLGVALEFAAPVRAGDDRGVYIPETIHFRN